MYCESCGQPCREVERDLGPTATAWGTHQDNDWRDVSDCCGSEVLDRPPCPECGAEMVKFFAVEQDREGWTWDCPKCGLSIPAQEG